MNFFRYKRRLDENEKHKNDKLLQKIDKKIEKSFKKKTQESLEESNRKEKVYIFNYRFIINLNF